MEKALRLPGGHGSPVDGTARHLASTPDLVRLLMCKDRDAGLESRRAWLTRSLRESLIDDRGCGAGDENANREVRARPDVTKVGWSE